jgi:hypothetical protein
MQSSQKKSGDDLFSIIRIIVFAGVILDSYSVYSFWKDLNDNKKINDLVGGIASTELDLGSFVSTLQKGGTLALLVFLIFDFWAYYSLFDYKNWARKYVLSIAVFYLIGCLFDFSLVYFLYSVFTIYYLFKTPREFLEL